MFFKSVIKHILDFISILLILESLAILDHYNLRSIDDLDVLTFWRLSSRRIFLSHLPL